MCLKLLSIAVMYHYHSGLMKSSANISNIVLKCFHLYSHIANHLCVNILRILHIHQTQCGPLLSSGTCPSPYLNLSDITVHSATPVGTISLTCFPASMYVPEKAILHVQNSF